MARRAGGFVEKNLGGSVTLIFGWFWKLHTSLRLEGTVRVHFWVVLKKQSSSVAYSIGFVSMYKLHNHLSLLARRAEKR